MSNVFVEGRSADTATVLLAAAEDLDLGPEVVLTQSKGYLVPEEVAKGADVDYESEAEAAGDYDPENHGVNEVLEYLEKYPDEVDRILAAEKDGKARKTVLAFKSEE